MPLKADLLPFSVTTGRKTSAKRMFLVLPLILVLAIIPQFLLGLRVSYKYDPQAIVTDAISRPRAVTAEKKVNNEQSRQFLTQNSAVLPLWFKEYAIFHRDKRLALTETNWKDQRFLIMRCLATDDHCGGASDRLQSIPDMLILANATRRLLFIKWTRPAPLQEFLVPPDGGLDWTIPDWLDQHLDFRTLPEADGKNPLVAVEAAESSAPIITFRLHIHDQRSAFYNARKKPNELAFHLVYRDMWNTLFTPSPPVAALIRQNMNDLNLVAGAYVATHVRALYVSDESRNTDLITNGINCATQLKPGWPIYFASDSSNATLSALEYGRSKHAPIVARIADTEPLHLDRGIDFLSASEAWKNVDATAFYNIFVDLYLLAGSLCVSYGVGGYGLWGALLSHNISCSNAHHRGTFQWTDPVPQQNEKL
jgi:hypothetical protein